MRLLVVAFFAFVFSSFADLEVHEWGSINIVTGEDSVRVGDISDDQSDLPNFVEVWKKQAVVRPMVIEKPILYFYTQKAQNINVSVTYPHGVFTQWWPKPNSFYPYPPRPGQKAAIKGGMLNWRVALDPQGKFDKAMPNMDNHPWWNTARDVDAATVRELRSNGTEKFLFYRGAGQFTPTLNVSVNDEGKFVLKNKENTNSREVYTIHVEEGQKPLIHYLPSIKDEDQKNKKVFNSADDAAAHLKARLEAKGLFPKEAAGMVKIWKKSMFEKIGQRAMYMMEKADIDKMLPLRIHPKPTKEVRVMLIRFECLSLSVKSMIKNYIKQLGAKSYKDRKMAKEKLIEAGRVGEAVIRTALSEAKDPEVKMSLKEVLKKLTPKNPNP